MQKNFMDRTRTLLQLIIIVAYEFTGTVKKIFPEQTFSSGFAKREIVVTSKEDRYPQDVVFEFIKEKMDEWNGVKEGEEVTVSFDLRGREYNGRYFVNLGGWRVRKGDAKGQSPAESAAPDFEPEDTTDYSEDPPF
jgi:single-strand DNA-binding protein